MEASGLERATRSLAGVSGFVVVVGRNLEARERSVLVLSMICCDRRGIVSLEGSSTPMDWSMIGPNSHATMDQWARAKPVTLCQENVLLVLSLFLSHYLVPR